MPNTIGSSFGDITGSRFSLEDPILAAGNVEHDQVPCFENIRVPSSKTITFSHYTVSPEFPFSFPLLFRNMSAKALILLPSQK
jgi:hypothetical protein